MKYRYFVGIFARCKVEELAGKADGKEISTKVKQLLGS